VAWPRRRRYVGSDSARSAGRRETPTNQPGPPQKARPGTRGGRRVLGGLARYAFALAATAAALGAQLVVWPELHYVPFLFFFGSALLVAWVSGLGPGLLSVALGAGLADFFFLAPRYSLSLAARDVWTVGFFMAVAGVIVRVVGREKESRLRAEEAVAQLRGALRDLESERRFLEAILGQLPLGVIIQRSDGRAILWSEVARRTFLAPPAAVERALRGESAKREDLVVDSAEGRRVFSVNAEPVRDEGGHIVAAVATFDDITDRRRYDDDILKRAELEQQLVGIVSHDLRNPLHTIMLAAQLLLMQEENDERTLRAGSRILGSVQRAQRLISDLLDFTQARLGGGIPVTPRPHDLHRVVRQALDDVRLAWPERGIIHEESGDARGSWDGDRVVQIVANLATNALRYSPEDTAVTVRTRGEDGEVVLEVHNEGEPIPEELVGELFQPLKRGANESDRVGRSVGLGLFIVDQLARAHGGSVEVESRAGAGTTFRVRLPRFGAAAAEEAAAAPA
jgi:signal transduction histidine kinase